MRADENIDLPPTSWYARHKVSHHTTEGMKKLDLTENAVHAGHCCARHGCKYGEDDCPVVLNRVEQKYPCESCLPVEELEDQLIRLLVELEWSKRMERKGHVLA